MTNPLMQFARKAELTVKLASDPSWYPENFINYTLNGEVEVYPMLPKDELMLYNPDALLSGQAMVNLIKSCCPGVSDPKNLYYPDANILLLAIKKATYGNEHKQEYFCPKCFEKLQEIRELEEDNTRKKEYTKKKKEYDKLIEERKITDHEEEFTLDINNLLLGITHLKDNYEVEIEGLIYNLQPHTLGLKEQYSLITNQRMKLLNMYQETLEREEDVSNEEKNKIMEEISKIQAIMIENNDEIFSESIKFIKLPDESIVSDKSLIKEFISNCKSSIINKLSEEITKINAVGLPESIKVNCGYCGHEFDMPIIGYNQTDFFG